MLKIFKVILLGYVLFLSGCATLVNSGSQYVNINSDPKGASVYIEGKTYITPTKVFLKRGLPMKEYQLLFEKQGYKPAYAKIEQTISGWVWLNILNGLIPGMTIDFITGGAFNLIPVDITVTLEKSAK